MESTPRAQPPTKIFHLTHQYKLDQHPQKLNLGVGAYRDESLKPVVFSAVRKAEAAVLAQQNDKEYLPVTGLPAFKVRARGLSIELDKCNGFVCQSVSSGLASLWG